MRVREVLSLAAILLAALPLAAQSKPNPKAPTPGASTGSSAPAGTPAGPGHPFKCMTGDGNTPCTAADVQELFAMVVTGKRTHKPLALIASLSLAGPDGTVTCTQTNGAACTDDQIGELQNYAAQQKKGRGCCTVMKVIDAASP